MFFKNVFNREVHDAEVANNLLDKLGIVLPVEQGQHNIHIRQRERTFERAGPFVCRSLSAAAL